MNGRDRRLLTFAYDVGRADDLSEFRLAATLGVGNLVRADLASYTEVDLTRRTACALLDEPTEPPDELLRAFGRLAHQHPLITRSDGNAQAISDFMTARSFHALELYTDVYRPLGAEDQIAIRLSTGVGPTVVGLALNRAARGFGHADRATLDLLRPLLAKSYQRVLARERGRELLERIGQAPDGGRAVIALGERGRVEFVSDHARRLLRAYFGASTGSALPAALSEWLGSGRAYAIEPLTIDGEHGRLEIWLAPAEGDAPPLLELREHAQAAPVETLTPRERQIAARAGTGQTNDELARALGISRRTVESHLRSVYRKLGVSNRTAAASALRA